MVDHLITQDEEHELYQSLLFTIEKMKICSIIFLYRNIKTYPII